MQGDDHLSAQTDSFLLRRFLAGDQASFEELFLRHYHMVYGVLYRLASSHQEAEDLAQEVFLKLYRSPLRHDDNVAGWLYRVAINSGYNALRSAQRHTRREMLAGSEPAVSPQPEAEAQRHELAQQVRAALLDIPEREAKLLALSQAGFSYTEIADIVGVAPGSVGTLLARARKAFLAAYEGDEKKVEDGSK
jgi:RNA polymerase sigma-70 factor (ECF subfamily)